MTPLSDKPADGRLQRSERSREAIVAAMLVLVEEGTLLPTAHQVAQQAGVGVRTVFRHFSDMDSLFSAMNDRLVDLAASFFVDEPQPGTLAERVEALILRRSSGYEKLAPYLRSSAGQRARSNFLQTEHAETVRTLRRDLLFSLPELNKAPKEICAAIEMMLSFEAFNRLRIDQQLSARRAQDAVRAAVSGLTSKL